MWLWERGHDKEWVLSLTLEQLSDLFGVCNRLEARSRLEELQLHGVAAQGTPKGFHKHSQRWIKIIKKSPVETEGNDIAALIRDFGKGF